MTSPYLDKIPRSEKEVLSSRAKEKGVDRATGPTDLQPNARHVARSPATEKANSVKMSDGPLQKT